MAMKELLGVARVTCPYCCQVFEISIDQSAGDQRYVEDCRVCCSPVLLDMRLDAVGDLAEIVARRENE